MASWSTFSFRVIRSSQGHRLSEGQGAPARPGTEEGWERRVGTALHLLQKLGAPGGCLAN